MGLSSEHVSGNGMASQQKHGSEAAAPQLISDKAPPLRCPRCESTNTKFCYYNNYSRLQPRHYCRACRRHWTEGGVLRDVPVGGVRKNKRWCRRAPKSPAAAAAGGGCGGIAAADADEFIRNSLQFLPSDYGGTAWFSYPPSVDSYVSSYDDVATNPFSSISSDGCLSLAAFDEPPPPPTTTTTSAWPAPAAAASPVDCWGEITDLVALELNCPAQEG